MSKPTADKLWEARKSWDTTGRLSSRLCRVGDCWLWSGPVGDQGYAAIRIDGRTALVHRVVWSLLMGEPPAVLDHVCHNVAAAHGDCDGGLACLHRRCANPAHMAPSDIVENAARGRVSREVGERWIAERGRP